MPYTLRKKDGYDIVKKSTGKKVAHATSKRNAGIYMWKAEGGGKRGKKHNPSRFRHLAGDWD